MNLLYSSVGNYITKQMENLFFNYSMIEMQTIYWSGTLLYSSE
ncbi:hypothetical protein LEP1GSC049_1369 [Leptospira kirschneri serovar Cynopteri str. 3522 CT]|nr:hypothetical protein LEP1GSC064_2958 [Leptospira kirschneri serovar Grippotyphosa str. Moskva]EKR08022.1 hypothetical protein LEP1GSC122_2050 [Leptospira kirschneri serovar Valbuzzi str. 200702274]EPG49128.1 hypothetical protein LEP1GSC049_1369 [Leptospira kirschneri serovar Cynopteri str. 3522 CT]